MTIVRVGTTKKYAEGWERIFSKGKKSSKKSAHKKTAKKSASVKKTARKATPAKKSGKKK